MMLNYACNGQSHWPILPSLERREVGRGTALRRREESGNSALLISRDVAAGLESRCRLIVKLAAEFHAYVRSLTSESSYIVEKNDYEHNKYDRTAQNT